MHVHATPTPDEDSPLDRESRIRMPALALVERAAELLNRVRPSEAPIELTEALMLLLLALEELGGPAD
jgi:hypothetical protein